MLKNQNKNWNNISKVTSFQILMKKTKSLQNFDSELFYFLIFGKKNFSIFSIFTVLSLMKRPLSSWL